MRNHYSIHTEGCDVISIWATRVDVELYENRCAGIWFYDASDHIIAGFCSPSTITMVQHVVNCTEGKYEIVWKR